MEGLEGWNPGGGEGFEKIDERTIRTTTRLRQLRQTQNGIVARYRLESDIAVPALLRALLLVLGAGEEPEGLLVDLLALLGADDTDFVIFSA
jgi:hypothetical protein